ncbi:phospholipase D family protein [Bdellovibrio sp. HCB2-146]|uniref:phospholipase D family protein n=1 Tax=Bdellovibrio sp. HCB2-146 TaxID=3394362 RepID=UPI0039BC8142
MADNSGTTLVRNFGAEIRKHPGQAELIPLSSGLDALTGRLALSFSATKTLDLQYYIWHNDISGRLMMESVLHAADRGVRVRLLLDEIHGDAVEQPLRAMADHPNIEVRLFNPFHNRSWKSLDFITRFSEANRRMHNKALIGDNFGAIVGGRNIGDEYFEASKDLDFGDFDVVVMGEVVTNISKNFDLFWNSELAVPIEITYGKGPKITLEEVRQNLLGDRIAVESSPYAEALRETDFVQNLQERNLKTYWGPVVALSDSPKKISSEELHESELLINQLRPHLGTAEKEVFIISPYFVPGDKGVAQIAEAVKRGVRVRILTNSLASNDVSVVHAGYKGYRKDLIKAGAELYELKPSFQEIQTKKKKKKMFSSRSGLHGKVYFFDRKKIFVGSMNLDPRSIYLNSEMGLVIDSPDLAESLLKDAEERLDETSYRLFLDEEKNLRWKSIENAREVIFTKEPETSWWQRFKSGFISIFVPESML